MTEPNLTEAPPYDPVKDEPFPWEADVRAAIEKLKAEKEAEKRQGRIEVSSGWRHDLGAAGIKRVT